MGRHTIIIATIHPLYYHKIYIHIMNYIYAMYVKEKGVHINIQSR